MMKLPLNRTRFALMGLLLSAVLIPAAPASAGPIWHAWGVHGGTATITGDGTIEATVLDTDGMMPDYHWNKSGWNTRTGQKAFVSTSHFNGQTIGDAITSFERTVTNGHAGNSYWNIVVEDGQGDKAIVAPSGTPTANDFGFATDGNVTFAIHEAEANWNGPASGAMWNEIKDLTITNGPFTEFPDNLNGDAMMQGDLLYDLANWAAWADDSAGFLNSGWEQDGVLFVFGQSTGTNPGPISISGASLNGVAVTAVPEPSSLALLASGMLGCLGFLRQRKRRAAAE